MFELVMVIALPEKYPIPPLVAAVIVVNVVLSISIVVVPVLTV